VNEGASADLSDAVTILSFLFLGRPEKLLCDKSADVTDNGRVDLSDAISLLNFKFLGGPAPREPYGICGTDPTPDGLGCEQPECP
jgi:hypothetical protein